MTRILVTGGRNYDDLGQVLTAFNYISQHHGGPFVVIEGEAKGADWLCRAVAKHMGWDVVAFPADWGTHGKAAGGIRNQQMIDTGRPDIGVAFPGGRGTNDMCNRMRFCEIPFYDLRDTSV